jgi:signal transduction histidine kinase
VDVCHESADALQRLVDDLFAYARAEYLDERPSREAVDMREVVYEAVQTAAARAAAKHVAIQATRTINACEVTCDRRLILRAVENVLDNAIRATPPGKKITIELARDEHAVVFAVADGGPGIETDRLSEVLAPLHPGESERISRWGGAGVGLAISRAILRAHGGDLTASNGHGGAVFRGRLPSAPSPRRNGP